MNHNIFLFKCKDIDCHNIANSTKDPQYCNIHEDHSISPLKPRLRILPNITLNLFKTKSLPTIINKSKITPLEPIPALSKPIISSPIIVPDLPSPIDSPILSRKSSMSNLTLNPIKSRRSSKLSLPIEHSNLILNPIKPRRSSELSLPTPTKNIVLNPIKPRRSSELSIRGPKHELQIEVDKAKDKFRIAKNTLLQYSPIEHSASKKAAIEEYYLAEKEVEEACKAWCRCYEK